MAAIQPSQTLAISERAQALRAKGVDVISFGVGEPDFPTPKHIVDAAKDALDQGVTRYTRVRGIPALVEAIRTDSAARRGVSHAENEVVVSVGAKHALFNLALALYDPGDEVIIPAPYWVSYPEQVALVGAVPKIVETTVAEGFKLSAERLEGAIGPKTKALILCSPSNPTGSAYTEDELRALLDVVRRHDLWLIVDEIYGQLVYDGFRHVSPISIAPDLRSRIVIIDGASKTYAMTGWRLGWVLAPKELAAACDMVQGQSTSNPVAFAQYGAIAALKGERAELDRMVDEFGARRRVMVDGLNAIPGISCRMPEGAFYAFPNVEGLYGRRHGDVVIADDMAVAAFLLDAARVAVVPGSAFGAPGFVRLSYATSQAQIREGLSRIAAALAT